MTLYVKNEGLIAQILNLNFHQNRCHFEFSCINLSLLLYSFPKQTKKSILIF